MSLTRSLDGLRSPYALDGGARRLVHALKYDGLSALAAPMGNLLAEHLAGWGVAVDLVAPVPLHAARERRRGFNQSALLARAIGEQTGLRVEARLLRRTRATAPQVRTGGAAARQRNVAGAFSAEPSARGRSVLLVDDVCTTGATVRACADQLRRSGAARVYALTFARED